MRGWLSNLWHVPGRTWAAMMAAGPLGTWLTAGAAMAWTIMAGLLVWVFRPVLSGEHGFMITIGALILVAIGIVALARIDLSLNAGRDGLKLDLDADGDRPAARVTATATVDVTPGAGDGELPPDQRVER